MRTILFAVLLVLAIGAGAFWLSGTDRGAQPAQAGTDGTPSRAYDYEARDVLVQQMGEDGHLLYQLEAAQIAQLPDNGQIMATGLTMHRDPPGAAVGGPFRWTLTADRAALPEAGGTVTLEGSVKARGRLQSRRDLPVTLAAGQLRYDLDAQQLTSDDEVALTWGNVPMRGRGLMVDIRASELTMASVNVKRDEQTLESGVHANRAP